MGGAVSPVFPSFHHPSQSHASAQNALLPPPPSHLISIYACMGTTPRVYEKWYMWGNKDDLNMTYIAHLEQGHKDTHTHTHKPYVHANIMHEMAQVSSHDLRVCVFLSTNTENPPPHRPTLWKRVSNIANVA